MRSFDLLLGNLTWGVHSRQTRCLRFSRHNPVGVVEDFNFGFASVCGCIPGDSSSRSCSKIDRYEFNVNLIKLLTEEYERIPEDERPTPPGEWLMVPYSLSLPGKEKML